MLFKKIKLKPKIFQNKINKAVLERLIRFVGVMCDCLCYCKEFSIRKGHKSVNWDVREVKTIISSISRSILNFIFKVRINGMTRLSKVDNGRRILFKKKDRNVSPPRPYFDRIWKSQWCAPFRRNFDIIYSKLFRT